MLQHYLAHHIENYVPLEIALKQDDDFLKVKETLTRIGIPSSWRNTLHQTAHILHKRGFFFIVHFKELYALDGRQVEMDEDDFKRRNTIARLLEQWGLVTILNKEQLGEVFYSRQETGANLRIISYKDKENWELQPKYVMGEFINKCDRYE